jgi:hypothetical protein
VFQCSYSALSMEVENNETTMVGTPRNSKR